MRPRDVSCVIPTRGNVELEPILDSLPFRDVIVWDNSQRDDLGIYGRYAAIAEARHNVIVTQDDDLIVSDWQAVLDEYEPGVLFCNYTEPWDIPWVARGAVFDAELPELAFDRYLAVHPLDNDFTHFMCDGIFGLLTPHRVHDHGSVDLPWANDPGRVSTAGGWYDNRRQLIQSRCAAL